MSRLDAQFAATGVPTLFEQLGRPGIVYTPTGGSPAALTAMVGEEVIEVEEEPQGKVRVRRREVKIARDPAGPFGGVADPLPADTLTIDGLVYEIEDGEGLYRGRDLATFSVVRYEVIAKGTYRFGD